MKIDAKVYSSLNRVYGSLTREILKQILFPSKRLYLRVNTMKITRDELLEKLREKNIDIHPDPHVDEAIYIQLKGPYKIPLLDKTIIVDKYATESIMIGASLYRPGIIKYDKFNKGEEVTVLAPNYRPVAIVKTIVSSEKLKYMRRGIVGETILSMYRAPPIRDLPEYSKGLFYPQSLPAIITTKILDPKPGELVIDMNAAPGGKTSHIVQLSRGACRVLAFERNTKKAEVVRKTLARLDLYKNVLILPLDSRYIHIDLELVGKPDKILIDPPCTGLGVRPKIEITTQYKDIVNSYLYQRQFLNTAKKIASKETIIVYSTCTLTWEENEGNILYAVRKLGMKTIDLGRIPYADKVYYNDIVVYRFNPLKPIDLNGYFIAVLSPVTS